MKLLLDAMFAAADDHHGHGHRRHRFPFSFHDNGLFEDADSINNDNINNDDTI